MTMQDFLVVGTGTLVLFGIFMLVGIIRAVGTINLWVVLRRYVTVRLVNTFDDDDHVMSRSDVQTEQTDDRRQTDEAVSAPDPWVARLQRDISKTAVIDVLVYSGWDATQIRAVLKGDNGVLGSQVEAARQRLGIASEPPRVLRVCDNGAPPRVIAFDPDFPYEPCET